MLWVEMFSCELEVRLKGMDGSALNPALLAAFSLHSNPQKIVTGVIIRQLL